MLIKTNLPGHLLSCPRKRFFVLTEEILEWRESDDLGAVPKRYLELEGLKVEWGSAAGARQLELTWPTGKVSLQLFKGDDANELSEWKAVLESKVQSSRSTTDPCDGGVSTSPHSPPNAPPNAPPQSRPHQPTSPHSRTLRRTPTCHLTPQPTPALASFSTPHPTCKLPTALTLGVCPNADPRGKTGNVPPARRWHSSRDSQQQIGDGRAGTDSASASGGRS